MIYKFSYEYTCTWCFEVDIKFFNYKIFVTNTLNILGFAASIER